MRTICCLTMLAVLAGSAAGEVPHLTNGEEPRDGREVRELREIWHRGHDDEFIFGAVRNVQLGPDGNTYVLDTQLSQVFVFDPAGELLRTLSREGEGPGESRRPEDLVFLPDGCLGIVQYINGRIVKVDLEGIPQGSLMPPSDEAGGGAMSSIRRARYRGGNFVVNVARVVPNDDDGIVRTQYLVRCDENARPLTEYLSRATSQSLMRDGWVEKRNYFPSHERWDIDDRGRVLAAADRDDYRISVFEPGGELAFTFGRPCTPWRRTEAQKQEIRDSLTVIRDGERVQIEVEVEDHDPVVAELHVRPDGEVWVLPSRSQREREPGILLDFDVFDPAGVYIRRVALAGEGDPDEDRLFFLGPDRVALVRGAVQARRNTFGGSRGEESEVPAHDLKVFSF